MSTLLRIDSSPRSNSISRELTDVFVADYTANNPGTTIITRDLVATPPPFVTEDWISNSFAPADQQNAEVLALSNELTDEFLAADIIVIGMPMYNFGVPANVKAWIDQIVRAGRTFGFGENGLVGLAGGRKIVSLISRNGAFKEGEAAGPVNHQEVYVSHIAGLLGITETYAVAVQSRSQYDRLPEFKQEAFGEIKALVERLSGAAASAVA